MAKEHAIERRSTQSGRSAITVVERDGEIEIPTEAYQRIEHQIPARIRTTDISHVTTDCGHRRRMKASLQTFVRSDETTVWIRSRALGYFAELLREAGYDVTCVRTSLPERFALLGTTNVGATLTTAEQERISLQRFGQFVVPTARAAVALVARIVTGFPGAPFVIPFASEERAIEFRAAIKNLVSEPIHYASGLQAEPRSRITVCTYWAAKSMGLFQCPGVIFAEWPGGMHEWMKSVACYPSQERMYLVRTAADRICTTDEEELLHFVGPMIVDCRHSVTRHEFHCIRFGGRVIKQESTVPSNKRQLYWTHHRRNVLVAALAREIAQTFGSGASGNVSGLTITILVEVPVHARQLQAQLPDWTVVTLDGSAVPLPHVSIITLSAADNLSEFRPDWVINGMGGPPSPRFANWLDAWARSGHSAHVVDLSDGFDPRAAELAVARASGIMRTGGRWRTNSRRRPSTDCGHPLELVDNRPSKQRKPVTDRLNFRKLNGANRHEPYFPRPAPRSSPSAVQLMFA